MVEPVQLTIGILEYAMRDKNLRNVQMRGLRGSKGNHASSRENSEILTAERIIVHSINKRNMASISKDKRMKND